MRSFAAPCAALLATVTLAAAGSTAGQDRDMPFPVQIKVGAILDVCATGQVVCPAMYPRCDDPKIAVPVVDNLDAGGWRLGLQGASRGTTLCSVLSTTGARQVFVVTVR
jgi:hypothetical protein